MQDMTRVDLQATWVLHHRPYRNTSIIADLITPDFGRVSVVANGVRSAKSRRRPLLQPFRPLLASWTGRSSLKTLTTVEESGLPLPLEGARLACGYYITELLLKLLKDGESDVEIFALYSSMLSQLTDHPSYETLLRQFEVSLLNLMGVMPSWALTHSGEPVLPEHTYWLNPVTGHLTDREQSSDGIALLPVSGEVLQALDSGDIQAAHLPEAKRIMRPLIHQQLGGQPLNSRAMFSLYR